jgi:hypothetical protein
VEHEITQTKAAHITKQIAERHQRVEERAKQSSGSRGGQDEMDTLDVLLYLSRLSGPHFSLEPTPLPSPEDANRGKVEQWLQTMQSNHE